MQGIDNNHSHLVYGFHQSFAAALLRLQLNVVDRDSTAVEHQPPELTPQYCIETTASEEGDSEINMEMALRESTTGNYLWRESFSLRPSYRSEAQRRIIRRVAKSLNVHLSAERLTRLVGEPDVNVMANFAPESLQRTAILLDAGGRFERAMQLADVEDKTPRIHASSAAVRDARCRQRPCSPRARIPSASRGIACALPRMEGSGSWPSHCRASRGGFDASIRVETTAYQAGSEINMVMVLRDDTTGIYVWSESFRLGLDNWFQAQQRVIRRIDRH